MVVFGSTLSANHLISVPTWVAFEEVISLLFKAGYAAPVVAGRRPAGLFWVFGFCDL
jgi:hypothetical protein